MKKLSPKWYTYGKKGFELVANFPPSITGLPVNEKWPYFVLAEIQGDETGWYIVSILGCEDLTRNMVFSAAKDAKKKAVELAYEAARLVAFSAADMKK